MRKMLALVTALLMSTFISTIMMGSVRADIESVAWRGSTYKGTDEYYGADVFAYEEGSTAILDLVVLNDYGQDINVSKVKVGFDWNINYTTEFTSPYEIESGDSASFSVTFTVPSTTDASNLVLHGYTIFVEHVNATGQIVDTMTTGDTYRKDPDFAVYSADQADAQELHQIISNVPKPSFNSTSARLLVYKAQNETGIGESLYERGDFAGARAHYSTSLILYNEAYTTEETRGVKLEDLDVRLVEAQINNLQAWASMVSSLSTTSILLGLAIVLFGIGYIIKQLGALKKPVTESVKE